MADLFNLDDESAAYELPEDTFSRPGSSYLDLGGFTYTPEEASAPLLQTSQEQYDTDMAAQLGMPLTDYQAISGTGDSAQTGGDLRLNDSGNGTPAWLTKLKEIGSAAGLVKDGKYDWEKIIGLGAAGLTAYDALNQTTQPVKTTAQLLAGMPSNTPAGFSAGALSAMARPMQAGNQLARQYAADMPSSVRPGGRGYAEGGEVEDMGSGALTQTFDSSQTQGYVGSGEGGGQDDMIDARLSPGEYVFDAESVSMLGDGDNAAGARKLDELREAMRAHKRSAPADEIAPKSRGPLSYMKGGLNG